MQFRASLFWGGLAAQLLKDGSGVNAVDIPDADTQCTGFHLDFSRLVDVNTDNLDMNLDDTVGVATDILKGRSYGVNKVTPVTDFASSECILQRHRLKETKNGVPIFGAEAIVTVRDCAAPDNTAFGGGYQQTPLSGISVQSILGFEGKTYTAIEEAYGYVPSRTKEDAVTVLANHFDTPNDKVGSLEETIFPSFEEGDFLSYRTEVWVSKDSDVNLYDVFISAHTLNILQICRKTSNRFSLSRRRNLRLAETENRDLQTETSMKCGSCASQATVVWSNIETTCPINSIYLNNDGRTTTCLEGTVNGQKVLGPGVVSELHYVGTYDCNGRESNCNANALPTDCGDALSDVHYGVTESLKFYQKYLGVMGGLRVNGNDPMKFASFVHFGKDFCNAFFTTETNALYFGDCDCKFWTPLTSLDVAAHELTHGVTVQSSSLIYSAQPGGLNEGYSDIMGATMEYYINDNVDIPDFNLGENLVGSDLQGFILRYMENPTQDGKSIDDVCSFDNDMNVHYASGVLNKAFTHAVRSCQADGCSIERDCVLLLGPLFMYANIHKLTALSGYLDSAAQTCSVVNEFYTTRSPETNCQPSQAKKFVQDGWLTAGVTVSDTCIATTTAGCVLPSTPTGIPGLGCFRRIGGVFRWVAGLVLSPFNRD